MTTSTSLALQPRLGRRPIVEHVDDADAAHAEVAVRRDVARELGRRVDDDDRLQVALDALVAEAECGEDQERPEDQAQDRARDGG